MEKKKILFISQEITPYLPESDMSLIGRYLPQGIQEQGKEIRAFMPRYGVINERRNQLHEVIRLSGMNLIINDTDHPLIIKVASIQSARMQVYFIDNEDFFQRKATLKNKEDKYFDDNDERSIFFVRGVLETVKKLRWAPDIVHCHGWISALAPLYIKRALKDDPLFCNSKVIYSVYNDDFDNQFNESFLKKVRLENITKKELKFIHTERNFVNFSKMAMHYSDGIIYGSEKINPELDTHIQSLNRKQVLEFQKSDNYIEEYAKFYDKVLS